MTKEEAITILDKLWEDFDRLRETTDHVDGCEEMQALAMAIEELSAEVEPTVIRSRTLMPTKDFEEWAKRIRKTNPNAVVIPCDAEVVSADAEKKKAELKENGNWDCPDVGCDECDHHRSVEWCSLAIPNHEKEIDETYKMVNEAFFEGFDAAEKRYRFLIETVEELDKKLAKAEWIPCSEKLPSEKDGRVLVTKRDEVMIAIYSEFSGRWYLGDMCAVGVENPIAWMPLPKPYKESEVEK